MRTGILAGLLLGAIGVTSMADLEDARRWPNHVVPQYEPRDVNIPLTPSHLAKIGRSWYALVTLIQLLRNLRNVRKMRKEWGYEK